MAKVIVTAWTEVHVPDDPSTPEGREADFLESQRQYAASVGGALFVVRTNAFYEPVQEPPAETGPPPIPDDGSTGGDG